MTAPMRRLFGWATPNSQRVSILLEELGLECEVAPDKPETARRHSVALAARVYGMQVPAGARLD